MTDPIAPLGTPEPTYEYRKRPDEMGWVIEKHMYSVLHYWTGRQFNREPSWSTKPADAIRFARAEDGAIVLSWCLGGDGNVVQHIWSDERKEAKS